MGVPRDASYASFLDEIAQDDFNRQRVTMIEGVPAAPGFAACDISTINLGKNLFRTDKQNDRNAPVWPFGAWAAGPRTASPTASIASASTPGRSSLSYANAASTAQSSPPPPPPQLTLPFPPKPMARPAKAQYQQIPPQQPDWDPGFRGLDEPITVSIAAMDSIKKRKESDKLCNNHFLRGPCAKGDSCFFVHDYKPSDEEINAIAVLARQNPCTNGQDCDSDDCIYGHHVSQTEPFSLHRDIYQKQSWVVTNMIPRSVPVSAKASAHIRFANSPRTPIRLAQSIRIPISKQIESADGCKAFIY